MISVDADGLIGSLRVIATSNDTHSPEQWAELASTRIVSVSDTAPQPIRDQAHAFKGRVETVVAHYIREAVRTKLAALAEQMEKEGYRIGAQFIRSQGDY